MTTYSIYRIYCAITGKSYVGKTCNLKIRWRTHRRELRKGKHHSYTLQRDFNQYGEKEFVFEVLETEISADQVGDREAFWVETHKGYIDGYNIRYVNYSVQIYFKST